MLNAILVLTRIVQELQALWILDNIYRFVIFYVTVILIYKGVSGCDFVGSSIINVQAPWKEQVFHIRPHNDFVRVAMKRLNRWRGVG